MPRTFDFFKISTRKSKHNLKNYLVLYCPLFRSLSLTLPLLLSLLNNDFAFISRSTAPCVLCHVVWMRNNLKRTFSVNDFGSRHRKKKKTDR